MSNRYFSHFVLVGLVTLLAPSGVAALTVQTIALSGQQAPGAEAGVLFAGFPNSTFSGVRPRINASGQVLFILGIVSCPL